MWQQFEHITINHIRHTKAEIKLIASVKTEDNAVPVWEKSFYEFLHEWFNQETFIIVKTSGSTGTPKEIKIQKNSMAASAQLTAEYLELKVNEHALLCLSCGHIAGKMMAVRAIVTGMNLIVIEPSSFPLNKVLHEKIDFAAFVPMQMTAMLQDELLAEKIKSIRNLLVGGSEISFLLKDKINAFSNNIYETFGMTETVSHVALKLLSQNSAQDYFETLEHITVTKDERDCLIIRAAHLNEDPIVTNDIVELIDENKFRWLGRIDNVVNSGGIKIFPESVEQQLKPHLAHKFFLAGISDEKLGQKLIALVETDTEIDRKHFLDTAALFVNQYEVPKQVFCVSKFHYTTNGKINRKATLADLYQ
jgi:o-succinylbenzoate---CoA ligase